MGQAAQRAPPGNAVHYERRRPEESVLYRLVQEQLETFLAQVEAETGASLPEFIEEEFDAFLKCGILAHGFLRLRCAKCAHEKLVAFSCKRRGFCASCGARRMVEAAAHPELLASVLAVIHRVIARFLIKQARLKCSEAHTGVVTLIQRFGSAANLNISALSAARRNLSHRPEHAGVPRGARPEHRRAAGLTGVLSQSF